MTDETPEALFQSLLAAHGRAVLKVARAYTASDDDARDLAQDILLQVWRSLPNFRRESSESTWVYRVALNTAISWKRKERLRRAARHPIFRVEDLTGDGIDGAEHAARREAVERLYAAIRRLPKADAALVLLHLDDLTYRQIAEVLGITETNVGVKLTRAKRALAELMAGRTDEGRPA